MGVEATVKVPEGGEAGVHDPDIEVWVAVASEDWRPM